MTSEVKRNIGQFETKLESLFDEKTSKILDDLIRESRKEIFESQPKLGSATPK